jgi:hypothetical protein
MRYATTRTALRLSLAALLAVGSASYATIPAPEKLLPDDTLVLITAPDFSKLRVIWNKLPQRQLWTDPAMKRFRDDFTTKWQDQFVKPLERDLDIKFQDYTTLLQGQLTFAIVRNAGSSADSQAGLLLLLDAKDKSDQLKKNLAAVRKKWVDTGRPVKTKKIRDFEFTVLPLSSNDIPKTIRKFFPKSAEVRELAEESPSKTSSTDELIVGQVESLLVISTSIDSAEKVVARATGGSVPPLSEVAAFQTDHTALFREAPVYGWLNAKTFIDIVMRRLTEKKENTEAPNPFDLKPEKILGAIGLNGLKTLAFTFQQSNEGSMFQVFVGVPESGRQGLFKILAGEPRESRPPPFIPSDAVKFQRWRIDSQKTWETLQKVISDISPQWLSGINFLIDTANTAAKEKDPGFDIKKNLIANLGDDLISYEKTPVGASLNDLKSPPSIFLIGSPNAESLAAAFKSVLVYATQQPGAPPGQREFLGRKIYSVSLKGLMMPLGAGSGTAAPRNLNYAASGGYVAFSSDSSMIEEYLRSSEGPRAPLKDKPGLTDAAQRVTAPGSSLFGYENQVETTRAMFEQLRRNAGATAAPSPAANLLPTGLNVSATVQSFKDLMDFSLLPNFDSISKYFDFSVYGGNATVDGLALKAFTPVPPALKTQ